MCVYLSIFQEVPPTPPNKKNLLSEILIGNISIIGEALKGYCWSQCRIYKPRFSPGYSSEQCMTVAGPSLSEALTLQA